MPATYITYLLDTGHWPLFSQPRELARVLRESVTRP